MELHLKNFFSGDLDGTTFLVESDEFLISSCEVTNPLVMAAIGLMGLDQHGKASEGDEVAIARQ